MPDLAETIATIIDRPAWTGEGGRARHARNDEYRRNRSLLKAAEIIVAIAPIIERETRASVGAWLEAEGSKRRSRALQRLARIAADAVRAGLDVKDVTPEGERARYMEEVKG